MHIVYDYQEYNEAYCYDGWDEFDYNYNYESEFYQGPPKQKKQKNKLGKSHKSHGQTSLTSYNQNNIVGRNDL